MALSRLLVVLTALLVISGCTSTPSSSGAAADKYFLNDIYNAKIGMCANPFGYKEATSMVGLARDKSPEERKKEKQAAWQKWLTNIEQAKSAVNGKLYVISHEARFDNYNAQNGFLYLTPGVEIHSAAGYTQSAVPAAVYYQATETYFYPERYPENFSQLDDVKLVLWTKYEDKRRIRSDEYSLLRMVSKEHRFTRGNAIKDYQEPGPDLFLGVWIDTKKWYDNQTSPISYSNSANQFVLDSNKVNFLEVFEVYPDTGPVYVKVSYIFEFSECVNYTLSGNLKEIILEARSPKPSILGPYTYNEFYRLPL